MRRLPEVGDLWLLSRYGLTAEDIARAVRAVVGRPSPGLDCLV